MYHVVTRAKLRPSLSLRCGAIKYIFNLIIISFSFHYLNLFFISINYKNLGLKKIKFIYFLNLFFQTVIQNTFFKNIFEII
jgi:hypothetical protein